MPDRKAHLALSVIIPANNEEDRIAECLSALFASDLPTPTNAHPEIIIIANGCTDNTVAIATAHIDQAASLGWQLRVLELSEGGKLNALNVGDANARHSARVYLDADVTISSTLVAEIAQVLDQDRPIYASGTVIIAEPKTWVSRSYRQIYCRVPFFTHGVPGCGLFAVNAQGRVKWEKFPDIISDDTFVRLQFTPKERIAVSATYQWPIVEGFSNLVKVRRRQDNGVHEIVQKYPELLENDDKPSFGLIRALKLATRHPIGFCIYAAVTIVVRLRGNGNSDWSRGR